MMYTRSHQLLQKGQRVGPQSTMLLNPQISTSSSDKNRVDPLAQVIMLEKSSHKLVYLCMVATLAEENTVMVGRWVTLP